MMSRTLRFFVITKDLGTFKTSKLCPLGGAPKALLGNVQPITTKYVSKGNLGFKFKKATISVDL